MIGLLAAMVLPLAGATNINVQVESGGVHLIAAAGIHTITIRTARSGNAAPPHIGVSRPDGSTVQLTLTGKPSVNLPFVPGSAGAVAYEITYPANARVEASDLSGDITIDNDRAHASLETSSGSIVANNALGELELAADTGDVSVTLARGWHAPSLRMQSGGGTLRLTVPPDFRARIDASTGGGQVHDALPRAKGGKPFVWLFTVKGDVWITRA